MLALSIVSLLLAAAAVALAVVALAPSRRRPASGSLEPGLTVVVVTRKPDEQTLHGVVIRDDDRGVTLAAASLLPIDGRDPVSIGDTWIPQATIAFVQRDAPALALIYPTRKPGPTELPDPRHLRSTARR